MPRRVPATPVEPRDGLRPIRSEVDDQPIAPAPEHDYSPPLHHRLSAAIGLLFKGEVRKSVGVVIGTSDMTVEDSEAGPLAMLDRIRNGMKDWKTTFIGLLTAVSAIVALFTGEGFGDELIEMIATGLAIVAAVVLFFVQPRDPETPTT